MTGPAIPPGAVRAAAEGIHGLQCCAAPCESADEHIEAIEECKGLATVALEAAAAAIAGAERERLAAGTRCITPCDDDCELQPDGCHELHQIPRKRTHLPQFCADIRAAIGAAAAAERERCARLAEKAGAIYPLPRPVPAVTVNGEPAGDTAGNTVIWPDGMPAAGPFASLLRSTAAAIKADVRERLASMDQDAVWRQAAERERLAQAAEQLKFRLYRPGNGPGAGTQALDVVPLTGLLALLREQPPATEGTTDAT